ncbi:MAG: thymidine phosphorylase [Aquabacterium sp.]
MPDADPRAVIHAKRDGHALDAAQIGAFVRGLVDGRWSDAQAAALAMAIVLRGMDRAEVVALTRAMTDSGERLRWRDGPGHADAWRLDGPFLDKHSTGGVGDKVSLLLAPIVAACGGTVPMISGRGLGHTGGTLDKLQAIPGYAVRPPPDVLRAALHTAGCAIVGASAALAPADARLYAIRDITATVESLPLIVASILSKKLAAGLDALVMDVKVGNGAFRTTLPEARELAQALVDVAAGAGLPTVARITDMNAVLGRHAGNALEVVEALAFLRGDDREPRLAEVTLALTAPLLVAGGLANDEAAARQMARQALDSGAAAERFARMVAALGGPVDVVAAALPRAPVRRLLPAPLDGFVSAMDTRALGEAVVALGGGRRQVDDVVDPRVGLADVCTPGQRMARGEPLLWVHAADEAAAGAALARLAGCIALGPAAPPLPPLVTRVEAADV